MLEQFNSRLAGWVVVPVLLCVIAYLLWPGLFMVTGATRSVGAFWSFLGNFLGYLSLLFSFLALVEVRRLSERYYKRQRLPELQSQIEKISHRMREVEQHQVESIKGERFIGEARVVARQLEKTKVSDFQELLERTEDACSRLEKDIRKQTNVGRRINELDTYWDLYRLLSEIEDSIAAYDLERKATL